MRTSLTPFLLGCAAIALFLAVAVVALGVLAAAGGWDSFRVGVGSLALMEFERTGGETSTTFGAGLPLLAAAGGVANVLAAALVRRRGGKAE